jgi:hypothetical protein
MKSCRTECSSTLLRTTRGENREQADRQMVALLDQD